MTIFFHSYTEAVEATVEAAGPKNGQNGILEDELKLEQRVLYSL